MANCPLDQYKLLSNMSILRMSTILPRGVRAIMPILRNIICPSSQNIYRHYSNTCDQKLVHVGGLHRHMSRARWTVSSNHIDSWMVQQIPPVTAQPTNIISTKVNRTPLMPMGVLSAVALTRIFSCIINILSRQLFSYTYSGWREMVNEVAGCLLEMLGDRCIY